MTYFAVAAFVCACALLASCDRANEDPNPQSAEISFNSATIASRAVITDDSFLQASCSTGEGIGVWGVVNNAINNNSLLIDNAKLTFDTDWSYTPTRHWIRNALHEFWAIYPYSDANCVLDAENGTLTRNNITLGTTTATNNVDYMCAFSSRDLTDPEATTDPVPLEMRHALSLLEFRFINATNEVEGVSNIYLEGHLYSGAITFGEDGSLEGSTDGLVDVVVNCNSTTAPGGMFNGLCTASPIPKNLSKSYNLFENVGSVVVMPQQVEGKDIMLHLSVAGHNATEVNLGKFPVTEWVSGKKYIYTLTLTPQTITGDVRVVDWIKDEVELIP